MRNGGCAKPQTRGLALLDGQMTPARSGSGTATTKISAKHSTAGFFLLQTLLSDGPLADLPSSASYGFTRITLARLISEAAHESIKSCRATTSTAVGCLATGNRPDR